MTEFSQGEPLRENPILFEQLQNEQLRRRLAVYYSRSAFYSGLDLGDSFDTSIDRAMGLVLDNKEWLDGIAESRELPEGTTADSLHEAIEAVLSRDREREPNETRKKIASTVLRQELRPTHSRYVWPFSLQRAREFATRQVEEPESHA